jgi:hypothetical protein
MESRAILLKIPIMETRAIPWTPFENTNRGVQGNPFENTNRGV